MRIIFEDHQYQATDVVLETLKDISTLQDVEKKVSISYVGYYYNSTIGDCVFILPKVLLTDIAIEEDGKKRTIEVLANIETSKKGGDEKYVTPEDIITPKGQEKYLTDEYRKFIYEFAVWIYRALSVYRKQNPTSKAIYYKQLPQGGKGKRHEANTYLDIVLSLIRFNMENQDFFMYTIRNIHSGVNKINWTKTVSRSQTLLQGDTAIYFNPVNKKRQINFDEELFVIFFSILNYINDKYGFRTPINFQYEIINQKRFEQYLKGIGQMRLREIRYKYFSDKALMLWDLCYAFFDSAHRIAVNTDQREYLLAKSFEHVFEAMIDGLIGDGDIPKGLKEQHDGKRVDHMYTYDALARSDEDSNKEQIYYIGDSKYYKSNNKLGRESIYKQYTYARNVIQWNIDLFRNKADVTKDMTPEEIKEYEEDLSNDKFKNIQLRKHHDNEEMTEGYNIIPNFFISAFVEKDRRYVAEQNIVGHKYLAKNGETADEKGYAIDDKGQYRPQTHISCQFENRLFDRDTLILSHYDVNFLYVVYLYSRNKTSEKATWRNKVRRIFRDAIRDVLEKEYDFFAMKAHDPELGREYINTHFKQLNGKIFTPYDDTYIYTLALKKQEGGEGDDLRSELEKYFYITKDTIKLGDDPTSKINDRIKEIGEKKHKKRKEGILIGLVKDAKHFDWIRDHNMYNIRKENRFFREGSKQLNKEILLVNKVVLYSMLGDAPHILGTCEIMDEDSIPSIYTYQDMQLIPGMGYPYEEGLSQTEKEQREYIMFEVDAEDLQDVSNADTARYETLINENINENNGTIGVPFVI